MTRTTAPWRAGFCLALAGGCTYQPATPSAGVVADTLVPITLADGEPVHLFIPTLQSRDVDAVYLRDDQGRHPVRRSTSASREDEVRSWERDLLVLADGPAGSVVTGGIGGLVDDLLTRRKD